MASVDNLTLLRWREMESIHVLRRLADHIKEDPSFHPRSSHRTTRWHVYVVGRDWEFLCTGPKFWDVRMERGGGGGGSGGAPARGAEEGRGGGGAPAGEARVKEEHGGG